MFSKDSFVIFDDARRSVSEDKSDEDNLLIFLSFNVFSCLLPTQCLEIYLFFSLSLSCFRSAIKRNKWGSDLPIQTRMSSQVRTTEALLLSSSKKRNEQTKKNFPFLSIRRDMYKSIQRIFYKKTKTCISFFF